MKANQRDQVERQRHNEIFSNQYQQKDLTGGDHKIEGGDRL